MYCFSLKKPFSGFAHHIHIRAIAKLAVYVFTFFSLISTCFSEAIAFISQQKSTTLYIVRHAETMLPVSEETPLNPIGKQRAQDLAEVLNQQTIHAIYTSHMNCDKETAKNVAKDKRLIINTYDSSNTKSFLERILSRRKGQNVLIVGNLETIISMLQQLSSNFAPTSLDKKDYSILFEVLVNTDNIADVTRIQYSESESMVGPSNNNDELIMNNSVSTKQAPSSISFDIAPSTSQTNTFSIGNPETKTPEDTKQSATPSIAPSNTIAPSKTNPKSETNLIRPTESKNIELKTKAKKPKAVPEISPEPILPSLKDESYNLNKNSLMLLGYDLVAYFKENKAIKGQEKFATEYRGAIFYFDTKKNLNTFLETPEKYLPQYGGWCALGMSIEGIKDGYSADKYPADPENFKIIGDKLYVFYKTLDYDALQKWNEETDEAACIQRADKYWQKINE